MKFVKIKCMPKLSVLQYLQYSATVTSNYETTVSSNMYYNEMPMHQLHLDNKKFSITQSTLTELIIVLCVLLVGDNML